MASLELDASTLRSLVVALALLSGPLTACRASHLPTPPPAADPRGCMADGPCIAQVPPLSSCTQDPTPICTRQFFTPLVHVPEDRSEQRALTYGVAECRVVKDPPELQVALTTWGPQEPFVWDCAAAGWRIAFPAADPDTAMQAFHPAGFGKGVLIVQNGTELPIASLMLTRGGDRVYTSYRPFMRVPPGASYTTQVRAGPDWIAQVSSSAEEGAPCALERVAIRKGRLSRLEITSMDDQWSASGHSCGR